MALAVDISVIGARELERKLKKLDTRIQKKVVRQALRTSAKRVKKRVVNNLSNTRVMVQSGKLLNAFKNAKTKSFTRRYGIRIGHVLPSREELGIPAYQSGKKDAGYYPYFVEYGHGDVPAHPFLRPAIDEHKNMEFHRIGRDIGRNIEREAGR